MNTSMHEAKKNLSQLVKRARAGEEVVLTAGKARTPIARIVPVVASDSPEQPLLKERPIGLFAAEMGPGPDVFPELTEEELALWEAPIVSTWNDNSPVSDEHQLESIEIGNPL